MPEPTNTPCAPSCIISAASAGVATPPAEKSHGNNLSDFCVYLSCTVSNFEQYTLAQFMKRGYFEKHINRMRLFYIRKRQRVIEIIDKSRLGCHCEIMENDSGLHFLLMLHTDLVDVEVGERLRKNGIQMRALSEYYLTGDKKREHMYIINYSNINLDRIDEACIKIYECLK